MNSPLEQNYYELLEIPRDATLAEIERAYERARAYYGADSVAVYALASPEDLKRVQERIDEAYLVLSDEPLRREYDGRLGPPGPGERPSRAEVLRAREEKEAPAAESAAAKVEPAPEPAKAEPPPEPVKAEPPPPEPLPVADAKPSEPAPEPVAPEPPPKAAEPPPVEVKVEIPAPAPEPVAVEAPKIEVPPKPSEPKPEPVRVSAEGPVPPPPMAQPEPAPRIAISKRESKPNEPALRPPKPEVPPDAIFSGELLRQFRESLGLSIQEIADRTKIGKPHLENIEADRFAALPAQVYLRGFLMSLARELRLDPLRVSKSYLEQMGEAKGRATAKPRS